MEKLESLVSTEWMAAHLEDPNVVLIDVAGLGQDQLQAYKAGHIPGATAWKWKEMLWDERRRDFPDAREFARRLGAAGISNDTKVVFYGEGMQFGVYAWWTFRYCGHRNVALLDGGRTRWNAEGRPLVTGEPKPRASVSYEPVSRDESMRILRDEVLATLKAGGNVLLDGRSPEEYSGARVGGPGGPDVGAVRPGRIPGAKHLHYTELLDADQRFKPEAQLRELAQARGATPDSTVITYCRMSHRATVLYFALTQLLGYRKVRVYDGSWTEWGNLVGVPIEK
ncbi:MAG: sulfurtransferase [Rhodospirillaceae bacterium]